MDPRKHLEIATMLHLVAAAIGVITLLGLLMAISPSGAAMALIVLVALIPVGLNLAAYLGDRKDASWAWGVSVGAALLMLFSFPIGTAVGAYILYVRFKMDRDDPRGDAPAGGQDVL